MFKAVIAGYSRSPFTMARKGELIDVKPVNLLAEVINNLVSKTNINKSEIEDIVIGWLSGIKSTVENKVEGNINGNDETIIKSMPWH